MVVQSFECGGSTICPSFDFSLPGLGDSVARLSGSRFYFISFPTIHKGEQTRPKQKRLEYETDDEE